MKRKTSYTDRMEQIEEKPVDLLPAPTAGASRKLTTSLFSADMEALEKVYALLRDHCGVQASRSDAIKIGLRVLAEGVADPATLRRHLADIKREDGRNRQRV